MTGSGHPRRVVVLGSTGFTDGHRAGELIGGPNRSIHAVQIMNPREPVGSAVTRRPA